MQVCQGQNESAVGSQVLNGCLLLLCSLTGQSHGSSTMVRPFCLLFASLLVSYGDWLGLAAPMTAMPCFEGQRVSCWDCYGTAIGSHSPGICLPYATTDKGVAATLVAGPSPYYFVFVLVLRCCYDGLGRCCREGSELHRHSFLFGFASF